MSNTNYQLPLFSCFLRCRPVLITASCASPKLSVASFNLFTFSIISCRNISFFRAPCSSFILRLTIPPFLLHVVHLFSVSLFLPSPCSSFILRLTIPPFLLHVVHLFSVSLFLPSPCSSFILRLTIPPFLLHVVHLFSVSLFLPSFSM